MSIEPTTGLSLKDQLKQQRKATSCRIATAISDAMAEYYELTGEHIATINLEIFISRAYDATCDQHLVDDSTLVSVSLTYGD